MNVTIRQPKSTDLAEYTRLLQRTYEHAYVDDNLGLTKDCFSEELFNSKRVQEYLKANLTVNENQKVWLAFYKSQIIGSITIRKLDKDYEVLGFYLAPEHQGQGIGKQLWDKAIDWADGSDILIDLYTHNRQSVDMYKKWGFMVDTSRGDKGYFYRHWPEWPEGLQAKCVYMRLSGYK